MTKPIRIQRKRVRGWRKPEGAIYVGRGSKWGNPFVKRADESARDVVAAYEANLDPATMAAVRRELRGKNLMCWCKTNEACHADVLLRIANEESE